MGEVACVPREALTKHEQIADESGWFHWVSYSNLTFKKYPLTRDSCKLKPKTASFGRLKIREVKVFSGSTFSKG